MRKTMSVFMTLGFAFLLLQSCASTTKNVRNLYGTYYGKLPCADCGGIDYKLNLNSNKTYSSTSIYRKNNDTSSFREKGTYDYKNDSVVALQPNNNSQPTLLKIKKDELIMLGGDGQVITGALASNFILTKNKPHPQTFFSNKKHTWILQSINGEKIDASGLAKGAPTMVFDTLKHRISGNASCNDYNGNFKKKGNSIHFSILVSTKMLCGHNMKIEKQFLKAISNKTMTFTVNQNILTLKSKTDTLAFKKDE